MIGIISNIQRFSLHDGPGVRTTVFFKGCPLKCFWCHNPEMYAFGQELRYKRADCVYCESCVSACPKGALAVKGDEIAYDDTLCLKCFACARECPSGALAVSGMAMTVEEVVYEALQDEAMYGSTGGGVTLSGGEASSQYDFALALIEALKTKGIRVALDTCGLCSPEKLMNLAALSDLVLFDIKHADPEAHRVLTGTDNRLILNNLHALRDAGTPVEARIPVIPGYNDGMENINAVAAIISGNPHVKSAVLLGYHPLGRAKIHNFNHQGAAIDIIAPDRAIIQKIARRIQELTGIPTSYR